MSRGIWFSIKTKFILITMLIVALSSATLGTSIIRVERKHLAASLEAQGRILMTSLKAPIINTIILEEMGISPGLLDNYVEEIVANGDLPTVYAFITDDHGKVLAHSSPTEFGRVYDDPLTHAALSGDSYRSELTTEGAGSSVMGLALPLRIDGKCWGALRVGLSTAPMEEEFRAFRTRAIGYMALTFVLGSLVFYIVACNLSHPLKRLSSTMGDVELGVFETKPLPARRDEIGQLQDSFYDMMQRLHKSEQERQKALNHVIQNEKMITIGRIVAGVAHEINNPLAAISACVYKMEGQVPPAAQNCLEILKASIPRIGTIVSQLSDFSRVRELEVGPVRSDQFFEEVRTFAAMALEEHGTKLVAVDGCQPAQSLSLDKARMHQVVLNLLLNAAAASQYTGYIELRSGIHDGCYFLTVRDRGHGIPEEEQGLIFDIFYTTKPAGKGSGIGLAVCKSIVDLHGGDISVVSQPGDTTFSVRIPLQRSSDA